MRLSFPVFELCSPGLAVAIAPVGQGQEGRGALNKPIRQIADEPICRLFRWSFRPLFVVLAAILPGLGGARVAIVFLP